MAGSLIHGKYKILTPLGHGGMGTVYRAMHEGLKREDALKKLHEQYAKDPAFVDRFMREARAMARLDHPNIIRIYDVFTEGDASYIAMEYFPGGSLVSLLAARKPLDQKTVVVIIQQIASALAYAHKRGIVHRDIKPGNILIKSENSVKIADFGIAAVADEQTLTLTGEVVGSPRYMCPEQARGQITDQRSDLFSLGMVFYQMLTGTTVFDGDSGVAIIGKLAFSEEELALEFPPEVSKLTQNIVQKLLQRNADDRFQSAGELLNALDQLDNGKTEQTIVDINVPDHQLIPKNPEHDETLAVSSAFEQAETILPALSDKRAGVNAKKNKAGKIEPRQKVKPPYMMATLGNTLAAIVVVAVLAAIATNYYGVNREKNSESAQGINATINQSTEGGREVTQKNNSQTPISTSIKINKELETKTQLVEKNTKSSANSLKAGPSVSAEDIAAIARVNSALAKLDQVISATEIQKRAAETDVVKKYAAQDYGKAHQRWGLLNKARDQAVQAKNNNDLKQSQQIVKDALALSKQAIIAYNTASTNAEKNKLAAEIEKNTMLLMELIKRAEAARNSATNATKAGAAATAKRLYQRAAAEENQAEQYHINMRQQLAESNLDLANKALNQSYNKYQSALRLYAQAASIPVPVTASVDDFEMLQQLFQTLRSAYEKKDIPALESMSRMSLKRLSSVKKIFERYEEIDVSIANIRLRKNVATATLVIDQLVKHDGSITLPAPRWKNAVLEVKKQENDWGKIQW